MPLPIVCGDIDLVRLGVTPVFPMQQGEDEGRALLFNIKNDGGSYDLTDCKIVIQYQKKDGTGGSYDTLPSGEPAYSASTSAIAVTIAPQVVTVPGIVFLSIGIFRSAEKLFTFPVKLDVRPTPGYNLTSENYFNVTNFVSVSGWEPGKFLAADADGNIIAVDSPEPSDEQIQTALDNYLTENPIQGGMTDEERQQLETNTQSIATNTAAIAENTAAVSRRVLTAKFALSGSTVTVSRGYQDGETSEGVLALDESGAPASFTEGGVECVLTFEGFGDEFMDIWEGGSY